jgi:V/A-type H+/Na+-transporting ATPase subunit D
MAEQVSPTRSTLLAKRDQKRLALQGVDLLKNKRDALIGEFFALVQDSLKARESLNQAAKDAYFSLLIAKAFDTPEAVESLSGTPISVDMKVESLYGVKVPKITAPEAGGALSFSPIGVGSKTLEAASAFRKLGEAIIMVANTENRLRKIGEEIKKTNRRVNALDQVCHRHPRPAGSRGSNHPQTHQSRYFSPRCRRIGRSLGPSGKRCWSVEKRC